MKVISKAVFDQIKKINFGPNLHVNNVCFSTYRTKQGMKTRFWIILPSPSMLDFNPDLATMYKDYNIETFKNMVKEQIGLDDDYFVDGTTNWLGLEFPCLDIYITD